MTDQLYASQVKITSDETITFDEFLKKYAEIHAEWVDGKVEIIVSNSVLHQLIAAFLTKLLGFYLDFKKAGVLIPAGVPMKIEKDKRGREPDILVILNEHQDRIKINHIDGAADIAIEIISSESDERDRGTKFVEYESGKVQEYWLVDPIRKQVTIYSLNEEKRYQAINPEGQFVSRLLPDFVLDADILWRENLPDAAEILDLLRQMKVM